MRIAYLIAAHAYPELTARLIKRIQHPQASIFIHIDKGVDIRPFVEAFEKSNIRDVCWAPRVHSAWGTFGQVRASLSLLQDALRRDPKAEMFVLISGQDYPLQSTDALLEFFNARKGVDFIRVARLPWSIWADNGGLERLTHYHFAFGKGRIEYPSKQIPGARRWRFVYHLCSLLLPRERPLPRDLSLYGGFNWWNLTRQTAELIFVYLRQNPGFCRRFWFTRSSDEIFFQTILMNAGGANIADNDLRCVFWDGRREQFPAVLQESDFPEIMASRMFFARKIHPVYSRDLIDRIDENVT